MKYCCLNIKSTTLLQTGRVEWNPLGRKVPAASWKRMLKHISSGANTTMETTYKRNKDQRHGSIVIVMSEALWILLSFLYQRKICIIGFNIIRLWIKSWYLIHKILILDSWIYIALIDLHLVCEWICTFAHTSLSSQLVRSGPQGSYTNHDGIIYIVGKCQLGKLGIIIVIIVLITTPW